MAITSGVCNSYKREILQGVHEAGDTYVLALYTSAATLSAATTVYTSSNEVGASGTYSAGGGTLAGFSVTGAGAIARLDFDTLVFTGATITARGALVYNSSKGNKAVAVFDFGSDIISSAGPFKLTMPSVGDASSLVRIT